jgi:hypothetical protein
MIFASCPPSSMTEYTSGCSFSTASETACTSCTNLAPTRSASVPPPDPVMKMRVFRANADFGFHAAQKLEHLFRLLGLVALVVLPENGVAGGIDHHGLHRGGTNVHPDKIGDPGGGFRLVDPARFRRSAARDAHQGAKRYINSGVCSVVVTHCCPLLDRPREAAKHPFLFS